MKADELAMTGSKRLPLCIDLDGTLVKSDLLVEGMFRLFKKSPFRLLELLAKAPFSGLAKFKNELAAETAVLPATLPFCKEVLDLIYEHKSHGGLVYLTTAAPKAFAEPVASHLGSFDGIICTTETTNLKGREKAKTLVSSFGEGGFLYVGDGFVDCPVFKTASRSYAVGPNSRRIVQRCRKDNTAIEVLESSKGRSLSMLSQLRPRQWVKNLLVFSPMLMAHQVFDSRVIFQSLLAFLAFCGIASATYIVNDLLDLDADRLHHVKRSRPLASGSIWISDAILLSVGLGAVAFATCWLLPNRFCIFLLLYLCVTIGYSALLKRMLCVDVICLACLYTIRAMAGGAAADVPISNWFLIFSLFLFTSLACIKRVSELLSMKERGITQTSGRAYATVDIPGMMNFGSATGCVAVLILALYINSDEVHLLYSRSSWLWAICPILLYWISRTWLLCARGNVDEDPIVFALRDSASRWCAAGVGLILIFSSLGGF